MSGGRWDQSGVPHKGWDCVDVVDLRADGGPPQGRPSGPPPGGPPPGGGSGGPSAAKGGATASASKSTDPADTNQDGTVSETERLAYASKQKTIAATESINTTNTQTS